MNSRRIFDAKTKQLISLLDGINDVFEGIAGDCDHLRDWLKHCKHDDVVDGFNELVEDANILRAQLDNLSKVILDKEARKELLKRSANRRMLYDGVTGEDIGEFVDWCWHKNDGHWPDGTEITDD